MKCNQCGKEFELYDWAKAILSSRWHYCQTCSEKEEQRLEKGKIKLEKSTEKIRKAEEIIEENTTIYSFSDEVENSSLNRKKYHFYKSDFFEDDPDDFENADLEITSSGEGYILSTKEEIIKYLITNNFDLKKAINSLCKDRIKQYEEYELQKEIDKLEERESKRILREKAEKRFYGKVKTKRKPFTEEEKDIIFHKFGNKCAICNKEEGLHIHHKDHNPKNNTLDNLTILCGVCHKKIHMKVR